MKSPRLAAIALSCFACSTAVAQQEKPNIIVFYTDDHGYADMSCQGVLDDIKTPNVDALAKSGVLARHGYSTAPQCVPSRAGLLVGKFQSKFGVESNGVSLDGFDRERTIAERLQQAGYVTAQLGKWHLGPGPRITEHGFKHVFNQNAQRPFAANITHRGEDRPMTELEPELYHVDGCSRAAAALIERYKDDPLFLYVAYRAPHVPLDAPQKYLTRFPGEMPQRRRQALAMLSAVDDGVGLIMNTLAKHGLRERTLIFYVGDNGAPLKIHKADKPGRGAGWDGSLNDPLNGEKGMLAEGGMHVPFVVAWPGTIPPNQIYDHPISALDVAATATAVANIETAPGDLDGVNLIPHLTGRNDAPPHDALMWRWISQSAIRRGDWKLLRGDDREYLYNLATDIEEKYNLASKHPDVATRLRRDLKSWTDTLQPPGFTTGPMSRTWHDYFDFYLDGKPAPSPRDKFNSSDKRVTDRALKGWIARGGDLTIRDGDLRFDAGGKNNRKPFLTRNGLQLAGPVTARLKVTSSGGGNASFSWRTKQEKEFKPESMTRFELSGGDASKTYSVPIPIEGELIHLRFVTPSGVTEIQDFQLESSGGQVLELW